MRRMHTVAASDRPAFARHHWAAAAQRKERRQLLQRQCARRHEQRICSTHTEGGCCDRYRWFGVNLKSFAWWGALSYTVGVVLYWTAALATILNDCPNSVLATDVYVSLAQASLRCGASPVLQRYLAAGAACRLRAPGAMAAGRMHMWERCVCQPALDSIPPTMAYHGGSCICAAVADRLLLHHCGLALSAGWRPVCPVGDLCLAHPRCAQPASRDACRSALPSAFAVVYLLSKEGCASPDG